MSALKMPFTAGLPETGCGAGSTLEHTKNVRSRLPKLLSDYDVQTLVDAPCGDFNWMAKTDLSQVDYIGCEYDPEHIRMAVWRKSDPVSYSPRSKTVVSMDVCVELLPPNAGMVLCRDFLQHLPNAMVTLILNNFVASCIPWFLMTSHGNSENADIEKQGMFRPLNLIAAPFSLPTPRQLIGDGGGRILGLWHRDDMKERSA